MPTPDALRGDRQTLADHCRGLDGQSYPAYRDLAGGRDLGGGLTLFLDRTARPVRFAIPAAAVDAANSPRVSPGSAPPRSGGLGSDRSND